jgi:hypothetical protein
MIQTLRTALNPGTAQGSALTTAKDVAQKGGLSAMFMHQIIKKYDAAAQFAGTIKAYFNRVSEISALQNSRFLQRPVRQYFCDACSILQQMLLPHFRPEPQTSGRQTFLRRSQGTMLGP